MPRVADPAGWAATTEQCGLLPITSGHQSPWYSDLLFSTSDKNLASYRRPGQHLHQMSRPKEQSILLSPPTAQSSKYSPNAVGLLSLPSWAGCRPMIRQDPTCPRQRYRATAAGSRQLSPLLPGYMARGSTEKTFCAKHPARRPSRRGPSDSLFPAPRIDVSAPGKNSSQSSKSTAICAISSSGLPPGYGVARPTCKVTKHIPPHEEDFRKQKMAVAPATVHALPPVFLSQAESKKTHWQRSTSHVAFPWRSFTPLQTQCPLYVPTAPSRGRKNRSGQRPRHNVSRNALTALPVLESASDDSGATGSASIASALSHCISLSEVCAAPLSPHSALIESAFPQATSVGHSSSSMPPPMPSDVSPVAEAYDLFDRTDSSSVGCWGTADGQPTASSCCLSPINRVGFCATEEAGVDTDDGEETVNQLCIFPTLDDAKPLPKLQCPPTPKLGPAKMPLRIDSTAVVESSARLDMCIDIDMPLSSLPPHLCLPALSPIANNNTVA
eukprot:GHVT01080990.1.p1 GENE.GHVT01080990.1~~GHVT01080990.1.p1  ORF type:complete len:499 (+),score=37.94 GHVT01080990.1:3573-5069(+)